jgi:hypothetical protein
MLSQPRFDSPRVEWNPGRDPRKTRGVGIPLYGHLGGVAP